MSKQPPAFELLGTLTVNQKLKKANEKLKGEDFELFDIEPLLLKWVQDVEKRLKSFERTKRTKKAEKK